MKVIPYVLGLYIIFFTGCMMTSAKVEYAPMVNDKYAPINANEQYGLISYVSDGADYIVEQRRKDAYKKMYEICHGRYKIVSVSNSIDGVGYISSANVNGIGNNIGNSSFYHGNGLASGGLFSMHRIYIKFKCVK
jgi:hypothetical protein